MTVRIRPWQIQSWQIGVLLAPIVIIVAFLLFAAGSQIRTWGLNWLWAVVVFGLLGWRWLLVKWTQPAIAQAEAIVTEVTAELTAELKTVEDPSAPFPSAEGVNSQIEAILNQTLQAAQSDPPVWEDWECFWQRCLTLVSAIAQIYYPEVKRPLLNIYLPDAYALIRGTVDESDRMMQKLAPVLGQVSIGQMVEGVELYRKLEPSAKRLIKAVNWAQWIFNPAAAIARQTSAKSMSQANQQLLLNLSNILRETALRNLAQQAMALYSGETKAALSELTPAPPPLTAEKTQSLRDILTKAEPADPIRQQPASILLVGRTGAGKSSLINTLFQAERAAVDVLPSTDQIVSYRWQDPTGAADQALLLWDTPGYEQVDRSDFREQVIEQALQADLALLVTPALDPALQMDVDLLQALRTEVEDLPIIAVVSQVDKLRPTREWSPPYNWRSGAWPKESAIREAVAYRVERLGDYCQQVLPLVAQQPQRQGWGDDELATALVSAIAPAKQLRLARFLRSREARAIAAAQIIDRYSFQMTTTEGLTKLIKSPVLQFISTLATGTPQLGALLSQSIPAEELPIVLGKLQMAYELFLLFNQAPSFKTASFDLLALWPLLREKQPEETLPPSGQRWPADKRAWALGQALTEYWSQDISPDISIDQLKGRITHYLQEA